MFSLIILLFSFCLLSPIIHASIIQHCDSEYQQICRKCKRGYVLNSMGSQCTEAQLKFTNCIQISILGECMRCDCGFSLKLGNIHNNCVITPQEITGCAVFEGNSTCIRPKEDFTLFKKSEQIISIQYGRGSNCEILNVDEGQCIQCHSGFKLDKLSKKCNRHSRRIINEYLSYFSEDGELQSRSIQLIATKYGIYPQIPQCIQQSSEEGMEYTYCLQCEVGKILSSDKTKCLKSSFKFCGKVADDDVNICVECLDNEHFYLDTSNNQHPECLPRNQQFDQTERCIQWRQDSPSCHQCAIGLVQTLQGCSIEKIDLQNGEQDYFDEENNEHQSLEIQREYKANLINCEYFLDTNTCASCKAGMIINTSGNCQEQIDDNCIIADTRGGCFKCISLMYFNQQSQKCIEIKQSWSCAGSSGLSNTCEDCVFNYFLDEQSKTCEQIDILQCQLSIGKQGKCDLCFNLYFLKDETTCEEITDFKECFQSDGLVDQCRICKQNYEKDSLTGVCLPKAGLVDGVCQNRIFYRNNNSTDTECTPYHFENQQECFKFNPNFNECFECESEYYLSNGECKLLSFCRTTDGINEWCYKGNIWNSYINNEGKVNAIYDNSCVGNGIIKICEDCQLLNGMESNQTSMEMKNGCYYSVAGTFTESLYCHYFHFENGRYVCGLCSSLFYPNSEGICQRITDNNCFDSNGLLNSCVLCKKWYLLREQSTGLFLCELQGIVNIPYCINIQGSQCLLCQNLYYIVNEKHCEPIHNPNCAISNGIFNKCLKSNENSENSSLNIVFDRQSYFEQISIESCQDTDNQRDKTHCSQCAVGYSKRISKDNQTEDGIIHVCLKQTVHHCEIQVMEGHLCYKCERGYYLNIQLVQNVVTKCERIIIPNCLKQTDYGRKCIQCELGYDLLKNGSCFQVHNCEIFQNFECQKCKDSYYLKDGVCLSIRDCVKQIQQSCLQCSTGFQIHKKMLELSKNINYLEGLQKNNGTIRKIQQKSIKIVEDSDECVRIPNCALSDGITDLCIQCDKGFKLEQDLCVRLSISDKNCKNFTEINECNKCKNLYYLEQYQCLKMNTLNCSTSNGIINRCTKCSFMGFMLSDTGDCQLIQHCQISNGLDLCILCEDSFIPNLQGICQKITISIPNCEIFSYQTVNILNAWPKDLCSKEIKKLQETNEVDRDTQTESQGCIKCENPYQILAQKYKQASSQECIPMSIENQKNCLVVDSLTGLCFLCQTGFIAQVIEQEIRDSFCVLSKYKKRLEYQGCAIISQNGVCLLCFEGFFKHSDHLCYPRNTYFKCKYFHPKKDMCLSCRSGYKLITIRESGKNKQICMKLETHEEVNGCMEYYPNTNKCMKCQNAIKIVRYVLNETLNICENVIPLKCRNVSGIKRNGLSGNIASCSEEYISLCEEYRDEQLLEEGNSKTECVRCANRYYLNNKKNQCIKHTLIDNCLIFSQIIKDTCEICQPFYYLFQNDQCHMISDKNCKISMRHRNACQECVDGFAVDEKNETCIGVQIANCMRVTIQMDVIICLACKNNFRIAENGKSCLLDLFDHNCLIINEEKKCKECKDGYFLNQYGECINLHHQTCQISNCLEFSSESLAEDIKCKKCSNNFYLNSRTLKCQPFDPDSDFSEEQKQPESVSTERNQENDIPNSQDQQNSIDQYFVWVILFFLVCVLCAVTVSWKLHSKRKRVRYLDLVEKEEETRGNNQQNQNFSFQQIQMQSYTDIDQANELKNEIE